MIDKIQTYFSDPSHKKLLPLFLIIAILITLPLAVFLSQQQQTYRQHASRGDMPSPTSETQLSITKDAEEIRQLTNQLILASKYTSLGPESLSGSAQKPKNPTEIAQKRKELLKKLLKTNFSVGMDSLLPKSSVDTLSSEIQTNVEKPIQLKAKLHVLHQDDFTNKVSINDYTLEKDGKKFTLYTDKEIPPHLSGSVVSFDGVQIDDVVAAKAENIQISETSGIIDTVGDQKMIALLIGYSDSSPQKPFTKEEAYNLIFNGQVKAYYEEQSYGKFTFSGDTFGWFTIPVSDGTQCVEAPSNDEIVKIVKDNNIDLSKYQRLSIFDHRQHCNSNIAGMGGGIATYDIDGKKTDLVTIYVFSLGHKTQKSCLGSCYSQPFSWTAMDYVFAHEFGHGLGLHHAFQLACENNSTKIYDDMCLLQDYGNPFDVMGFGGVSQHFHNMAKKKLGWIDENSSLVISKSGEYTLNPLEKTGGIQNAIIQTKDGVKRPFALEFRRGIGFDAGLNEPEAAPNKDGILVYSLIHSLPGNPVNSVIIDLLSYSQDPFVDNVRKALTIGATFDDPGHGITLGPVISASDEKVTFNVDIHDPVCVNRKPNAEVSKLTMQVAPSDKVSLFIPLKNTDSYTCGKSNITLELSGPSDWKFSIGSDSNPLTNISESASLNPGEIKNLNIYVHVPSNANVGEHNITAKITNSSSGLQTIKNITYKTTQPPLSVNLKAQGSDGPVIIPFGTKALLSWETTNAYLCQIYQISHKTTLLPASNRNSSLLTDPLNHDTEFRMECVDGGFVNQTSDTVVVKMGPAKLTADLKSGTSDGPTTIPYNGNVSVSWHSTQANSCVGVQGGSSDVNGDGFVNTHDITLYTSLNPGITKDDPFLKKITEAFGKTITDKYNWAGTKDLAGTKTITKITEDLILKIMCSDANNKRTIDSLDLKVGPAPLSVDLKVENTDGPITVAKNASVSLSWQAKSAFACQLSSDDNSILYFGSNLSGNVKSGNLIKNTTFTMQCNDTNNNSTQDKVNVDVNSNITPTPIPFVCTACAADIAGKDGIPDGIVNGIDFNSAIKCFGKQGTGGCAPSDINKDGFVNIRDITCISGNFKKTCSSTASPAKK